MKFTVFNLLALSFLAFTASADEMLSSLEEIGAFVEDATPRKVPFAVTGRVLSNNPSPKTGEIILTDGNGLRNEFFRFLDLSQPEPGDTIRAEGFATMSRDHEPYLRIEDFTVLEHGPEPVPLSVRLSETNARDHHLMLLRTEGTVIDAFVDEIDHRYMILLLRDLDTIVPVTFARDTIGDLNDLIDATIRVTGIYRRNIGGVRKFAWPTIIPHRPEEIEVLKGPPDDPFAVPPLENRLYLTAEEIARLAKRSVTGTVLATWSSDRTMLRTEDGQVVNLRLASGQPLPECGMTVVAAGQPETDLFRINLSAAHWKPASRPIASEEEEPEAVESSAFWTDSGRRSIKGEAHGKLLLAHGLVRTLPSPDDAERRFALDTGDIVIPIDVSSCPDLTEALEIGCEVDVTGRCILQTGDGGPRYRSSRIRGLTLVVRRDSDVVVLSRPSWWTPLRLSIVISLLLAALVAVYIWNRTLRRLADRRGRELYREQVAHAISEFKTGERTRLAVELHDSLSQTLSGVACHLSVGDTNLDRDPATAREYLTTARKMLNSCRTELRQCLFDLRSDTLEEPDFAVAIRKTLAQIESDAAVTVRFNLPRQRLKDTTAHAILSIVRELTGNAIRHGKATEVKIAGTLDEDRIRFSVRDNGRGFDRATCAGPIQGHFGLEGIRNRLDKLSGTFDIESAPGAGTKAVITIPIPKATL